LPASYAWWRWLTLCVLWNSSSFACCCDRYHKLRLLSKA
jgi:hypothetical protein